MQRFGMFGKVVVQKGKRDEMMRLLFESARVVGMLPGCCLYVVNVSPTEPDAIWVYEAWRTQADHDESLQLDNVKAIIAQARPLMASFESSRFVPVGGHGLNNNDAQRSGL